MCVCLCVFICVSQNRGTQTLICVCWNRSNCPLMLVPTFPWQSVQVCFGVCLCLCVRIVCVCACAHTQHGIPIPGPNPVILRLSHSVKCSSHSFLNSPHSLVASNVNPDAHKQNFSKWHPIHYTPPHTKKGEYNHLRLHTHTNTAVSGILPIS